jgi:hypothetical protein
VAPPETEGARAGSAAADSSLPRPCPRFATPEEWQAWHASLTWEQRRSRANVDRPEYEHSQADLAKALAREERRRAQRWDPDPLSYADDRRDGPWPRVDQLEIPALSNSWRMDPACGYSPAGFALRMRPIPYRDLVEERLPARVRRDPAVRLAWLRESIEREEVSLRGVLKRVLRERHGRLLQDERHATMRAMAWCHLFATRCQLRALRELAKAARAELQRTRSQLSLF